MGRTEIDRRVIWIEWALRQERVWSPADRWPKGRAIQGAPKFPIWAWQEPGLGYFFGIEKSGYKTDPVNREYRYGPFSKAQARRFLSELTATLAARDEFVMSEEAMLNQLVGGMGRPVILIEVDAATLATIWKSHRFGRTPYNVLPSASGAKMKRAGTF